MGDTEFLDHLSHQIIEKRKKVSRFTPFDGTTDQCAINLLNQLTNFHDAHLRSQTSVYEVIYAAKLFTS